MDPANQFFTEGDAVLYRCKIGFKIDSHPKVRCHNTQWSHIPKCICKKLLALLVWEIINKDDFIIIPNCNLGYAIKLTVVIPYENARALSKSFYSIVVWPKIAIADILSSHTFWWALSEYYASGYKTLVITYLWSIYKQNIFLYLLIALKHQICEIQSNYVVEQFRLLLKPDLGGISILFDSMWKKFSNSCTPFLFARYSTFLEAFYISWQVSSFGCFFFEKKSFFYAAKPPKLGWRFSVFIYFCTEMSRK